PPPPPPSSSSILPTGTLPAPLSPAINANCVLRSSAPSSASPRHSALRKTDTQFSFNLKGISPKINRRFEPPPGALEAIQKLREDLNTRLDALTESISPRNTRVGFIDVVTRGDNEGEKEKTLTD
ncbi:hypothetical protein PENTCL1PPCAC_11327, partial [Pristionchus entomophagus]